MKTPKHLDNRTREQVEEERQAKIVLASAPPPSQSTTPKWSWPDRLVANGLTYKDKGTIYWLYQNNNYIGSLNPKKQMFTPVKGLSTEVAAKLPMLLKGLPVSVTY